MLADPLLGSFDAGAVWAGNHDRTVVFDVDFGTGFGSNLLDGFTTLTDDFTDLVGIDL